MVENFLIVLDDLKHLEVKIKEIKVKIESKLQDL